MDAYYETGYITETDFQTMIYNRLGSTEFYVTDFTASSLSRGMLDMVRRPLTCWEQTFCFGNREIQS